MNRRNKLIMMRSDILLMILLFVNKSSAFPAEKIEDEDTVPHYLITSRGLYKAVLKFLDHQSVPTSFEDYFGAGELFDFRKFSIKLGKDVGNMQREYQDTAFYHVNGETIDKAHAYVNKWRKEIIAATDMTEARSLLVKCLYIIQSFYSNTNWVELNTEQTWYKQFGQDVDITDQLASKSENTCTDCQDASSCQNNIITTQLTSAYRSGQDITKPVYRFKQSQNQPETVYKCGHGGDDDAHRNIHATGGIYKGRSNSQYAPHHHLHQQAVDAAVEAVAGFLADDEVGLLSDIGLDKFQTLLDIKAQQADRSLAFVLDVTGSMHDEIQEVKDGLVKALTLVIGSDIEPVEYILVTFSDPVSKETSWTTTDGLALITKIEQIVVGGGRDCPEYSITGILTGVNLSRDGSKVVMITDASPKDPEIRESVNTLAISKNVNVDIIELDQCTRRRRKRRSATHRRTRRSTAGDEVYANITTATGGTIYRTTTDSISVITQNIIQQTFRSTPVNLKYYVYSTSATNEIPVEVDNRVTVLNIGITGASSESEVGLRYPNGSDVSFSSGNATILTSTSGITLVIQQPTAGLWTLLRLSSAEWTVNVTATSTLDFTVSILETGDDGYLYSLQYSPIIGENYTIEADLYNPVNASADMLVLTNENGHAIMNTSVTESSSDNITTYKTEVKMENTIYGFRLEGTDGAGNKFVRSKFIEVKPVTVKLHVAPYTGNLWVGGQDNITYEVTNTGDTTTSIVVEIQNNKGHAPSTQSHDLVLNSGTNSTNAFTIQGTKSEIVKYTVEVKTSGTLDLLQSRSFMISVSSIRRPSCNILTIQGDCPSDSLNSLNCSSYKWTGQSEINFSGTTISRVFVSNTDSSSVVLEYTNTTGIATGPISANLSADCCTPSLFLEAIDTDGYWSTPSCHYNLADGISDVVIADKLSDPNEEKTRALTDIIAVTVSVCAVAGAAIALYVVKAHVMGSKTQFSNVIAVQAVDSVKKNAFNPKNHKR